MRVRRLVNELLVISPVLLIAGITVNARTKVDDFEPAQYSSQLNRDIVAYAEPVRLVEAATVHGNDLVDPIRIRQIAETWRNMTRQGTLRPLRPERPDDTCREGIKGQVRAAGENLAFGLQVLAQQELSEGRTFQAAQDAVLAMEAVQGVKYSDLFSIGAFAVRENSSLQILEKAASRLNASEKASITARLAELRAKARPLADIVMATQRVQRSDARYPSAKIQPYFVEAFQMARDMDRDYQSARFEALYSDLGKTILAADTDGFLPELRFALYATRNVMRDWSEVTAKLG